MAVENRGDELAAGAYPLDEFLAEQLAPAALHVRGQAQNSACFTDLAAEAGFQSLCAGVARQFGSLVESAALQVNQGPGQRGADAFGRTGRFDAGQGQGALVKFDRRLAGADAEFGVQAFAQAVELTNGLGAVASVQRRLHQGALRLFVRGIERDQLFP